METLTAIFGSEVKIKILRLFLFNERTAYFLPEIIAHTKCGRSLVKREVNMMAKADLLKKKTVSKEIAVVRGKNSMLKKIKGIGYILNEKFSYREPLKNLLTIASIQADESLARRFSAVGRVKLIVAAGVFIQNWDSRVDLLIVGDELNMTKIESIISVIESEIGKEISYSA
ncbi:MAG: hypothetical protein NTZ38_02020, partial [Candidatus Taylorbacteria bacterium]|nr:hypothetical protein [Candidatus Taylorbacteria bacterium]